MDGHANEPMTARHDDIRFLLVSREHKEPRKGYRDAIAVFNHSDYELGLFVSSGPQFN